MHRKQAERNIMSSSSPKKARLSQKTAHNSKYNPKWKEIYSWVAPSTKSSHHAYCTFCKSHISVSHGAADHLKKHQKKTKVHMESAKAVESSRKLSDFFCTTKDINQKVRMGSSNKIEGL